MHRGNAEDVAGPVEHAGTGHVAAIVGGRLAPKTITTAVNEIPRQ